MFKGSSSTLFVATIMGMMTRMGAWGEVLVTVRDQGGERVDCVGWLHNRNFIGLWKRNRNRLQRNMKEQRHFTPALMKLFHSPLPHDLPATAPAVQLVRLKAAHALPQILLVYSAFLHKRKRQYLSRDCCMRSFETAERGSKTQTGAGENRN